MKASRMERRENDNGRTRIGELLKILRCSEHLGKLDAESSGVRCQTCGRYYPVVGGVFQFTTAEDYAASFGFEWSTYARTQLDHNTSRVSEETFRRKTGFTPEDLKGKWVLDVGCGMGRFAEVASRWGAKVVATDLSRAAEVAAQNLADRDHVWVCQADLFRLPFAPESFDYMYSLGVLHHTPNCDQAFKTLPQFLKPGRTIAIWVYSAYNKWYRISDFYWRITSGLPSRWLHALCQVAGPLYHVHRCLRLIPVVGRILSGVLLSLLPMSLHPAREWRVLDTFDWYSPTFQSKHTCEEVFRWFQDSGLRDLRVLFEPVAVQGRKAGFAMLEPLRGDRHVASRAS